jgi:hypothetical protein
MNKPSWYSRPISEACAFVVFVFRLLVRRISCLVRKSAPTRRSCSFASACSVSLISVERSAVAQTGHKKYLFSHQIFSSPLVKSAEIYFAVPTQTIIPPPVKCSSCVRVCELSF